MSDDGYYFEIEGKIKPYVRMTQRGKWVKQNAQEYLASRTAVEYQFKQQMTAADWDILPGQTPLRVRLEFWEAGSFHNKDLDNQVKAVLDAMQGYVFPDDRWVDMLHASRARGEFYLVQVYIEVIK